MKTIRALMAMILALVIALSLCACGKSEENHKTTESFDERPEMIDEIPNDEPEPMPEITKRDLAETMLGEPIEDLIDMIGEPISKDYAPSCLGPGEDGELVYEDFIVYTYREGDKETVEEIYNAK